MVVSCLGLVGPWLADLVLGWLAVRSGGFVRLGFGLVGLLSLCRLTLWLVSLLCLRMSFSFVFCLSVPLTGPCLTGSLTFSVRVRMLWSSPRNLMPCHWLS